MTMSVLDYQSAGAAASRTNQSAARRADSPARKRRRKAVEFWLYFAATYPIFLVIAIVSRFLPRAMRPFGTERGRSVFGDAKAAAYTVLPFVFMG